LNELDLVRGLREKRDDAVQVYLERYRSLFYHCIGHFEADPSLRDDLFQELTWHAIDRLCQDSFDPSRGSFGTWLYRVAWCRCVDLKRRQNARRRVRLTLPAEDLPDTPDETPGPGEAAGNEEVGTLVRAAFGTLEEQDRRLLELRYVEGHTLVQISEDLRITVEQAKYRLKRASAIMRKALLQRVARQEAMEG
jgi:RNA polymerase sigma-70 factor (ECF subfamily)